MFSLELPHRGDSKEYTQYTVFNMNKKITLNHPKSAAMGFYSKGLKNEFETAVVNEPSAFEPLRFYCSFLEYSSCGTKLFSYVCRCQLSIRGFKGKTVCSPSCHEKQEKDITIVV